MRRNWLRGGVIVLVLVVLLLLIAGLDLLVVRRKAVDAKLRLLNENRREMRAELTEYFQSKPPTDGNGKH